MREPFRRNKGGSPAGGLESVNTLVLPFLLITVLLTGCNVFNWTSNEDPSPLERGLELMRQGEYGEAEAQFALIMAEDPQNGDARYHHAKAVLNDAGFSVLDLIRELSRKESDRETDGVAVPLYSMETTLAHTVYTVNFIIIDDLVPIYAGQTHGTITAADVDMDLAIAYLITAILSLRDTNQDSAITTDDLVFDVQYSSSVNTYSLIGLDQFLGEGAVPNPGSPKGSSISPDQINPLIDAVLDLIDNSRDIVVSLLQDLTGGMSIDAVESLVDDIRTTIVKYYYDDDKDNDQDNRIDEEELNGLDDDGDGFTDEDTDHV